jgi:primase-polymerase (primpol)-like protein
MLTKDSGIVAIDLDHCRNPETGELTPMAQRIVDRLNSYTEVSPSGEGLHIFVHGTLPPEGKRRITGIELYDSRRYLTVTGHRIESAPALLEARQDAIDALHAWISGDAALVEAAKADDPLFAELWGGVTAQYNGDDSAADLALCNKLAPRCGNDPVLMDRIFRWSALMRPKWDEPRGSRTYGQMTKKSLPSPRENRRALRKPVLGGPFVFGPWRPSLPAMRSRPRRWWMG